MKQQEINIPFTEVLKQMPTYASFMKDLLTKNRRLKGERNCGIRSRM